MHEENGDVHEVNGDNRQFRTIKTEIAEPGCFHQICPVEIGQPQRSHEQSHDRRVCWHICHLVHTAENMGCRAFSPVRHGVKTAGACHHQTIQRPNAGNDNEHKQQCSSNIGKYCGEGNFCASFAASHNDFIFHSSCQTYIVQSIHKHNKYRTKHQRPRQVLFGILQFCVNAGGTNPSFISKAGAYHRRKQRISADFHNGAASKILYHNAISQSVNGTYHRHQSQRNQFCHSGGHLKFPCQHGRNGIDGKTADQIQSGKGHCLRAGDVPSQQNCCVSCRYPCHHRSHGRKINNRHKPRKIIAIFSAHHYFRIIHNTADFFITGCHNGKIIGADDHHQSP